MRAVAAEYDAHPLLLTLMKALQDSHMGVYRFLGSSNGRARLQPLSGGDPFTAEVPSGYSGRLTGELWYTRVLPPPMAGGEHVAFTSPYVLVAPDASAWLAYFDRAVATVSAATREQALEQHFRWGPSPRYWPEFVFEGYASHEDGAIFLLGLPDSVF